MSDGPTVKDEVEVPESQAPDLASSMGPLFKGMDEELFANADAVVNESYLDTPEQQRAIERMRERALTVMHDYRTDDWYRAEASVKISLAINVAFAAYQVWMAIRYGSVWFAALGMYSIMLTFTRATIVRYLRPDAKDGREELERYRSCGELLVMLTCSVAFLGMVVNFAGEHPVYPGSMLYVIGAYTLYSVYMSISNLITYRKLESPLISASKSVAVACALVSLYSLQAAALAYFCTDELEWIRTWANIISAVVICGIILTFAVHIIVRADRALAGKEDLSMVAAQVIKEHTDDNDIEMLYYNVETQRQLDYWQHADKVEWRTRVGAHARYDAETQMRLRERDNRKKARKAEKKQRKQGQKTS